MPAFNPGANPYGAPSAIMWQPNTSQIRPNVPTQVDTARSDIHHSPIGHAYFPSGFNSGPSISRNGGATTFSYARAPQNGQARSVGQGLPKQAAALPSAMTTHLGSYRP